ncbi:hypothetical protein Slin15195_G088270 [Septoria linicola]|uniref:Uncharacterized protein n=1 Tax=Septoria linicola TaxID=215465 RepID=A0A9Q9AYF2_9PEZI|nr:hypothetical protein Slin14017_G090880 [Septoria linicola]USW55508.1 hypothetical protein Slin15195_G088270 [Septoria linicola]
MFSINLISSLFAISASISSVIALPATAAPPTSPNLRYRELARPSWEKYNKATADFTALGLCRYYIEPSACCDNLAICQAYCKSNSVSCIAGDYHRDPYIISDEPNPNGERYTMGKCECNVDLQQYLAELITEMTAEAGGVICEVWLESFNYAAQILETAVLPLGVSLKTFRFVINAVQKASTVSGLAGFDNINSLITTTCGSDVIDASKLDIMKEAYRMLASVDLSKITEASA